MNDDGSRSPFQWIAAKVTIDSTNLNSDFYNFFAVDIDYANGVIILTSHDGWLGNGFLNFIQSDALIKEMEDEPTTTEADGGMTSTKLAEDKSSTTSTTKDENESAANILQIIFSIISVVAFTAYSLF